MPDVFRLLVVDDERNIRSGLARGLAAEADEIDTAESAEEAIAKAAAQKFQIVIADVRLPGPIDGLELVTGLLRERPDTTVIVITAHGTVETAVEAMRRGAFDFIIKPVDLNLLRHQVRKARKHHELISENRQLRDRLADAGEVANIIGNSTPMQDVFHQIRQVATTDATVLIYGESGTGKELVARALHDLSARCGGPFIAVNLGALPETLLESELFGHERGAFSGASRQKPGCFELAMGGSLFLDEVTEMVPKSQIDLLRVLETGRFRRVGGEQLLQSDARIISATNKDITELVARKEFREDLYYRLNVVPIEIPPLRERGDDIAMLVDHFLAHFCQRHGRRPKALSAEAIEILSQASWPGNVRQLRNTIERLVVTVAGETIEAADLPEDLSRPSTTAASHSLAAVVEAAESEAIRSALVACQYHRERAARQLEISIRTLHYKMNRYGLHEERARR